MSEDKSAQTPIDLHVVSWNRPAMTRLVIKTIHRNTKPGTFKVHVFDNGSDEKTCKMLQDMFDSGEIDDLYIADKNYGLEYARDWLRTHKVKHPLYFVCIDNDCLPEPPRGGMDWLQRLKGLMDDFPNFAAISARTQVMIGTGNIFEEADKVHDPIVEFPHPGGSLRIMSTYMVEAVGGWARDAKGRGAEERYIGGKLNEAGYHTAFATEVKCLHLFGLREGSSETDRWGYSKDFTPEDTGHTDVSHPALTNGDDIEEIAKYAGKELADDYRNY